MGCCGDKAVVATAKRAKKGFERNYLIQLVELTRRNISRAAKLAGKYRADFYDLLQKCNLNPKDLKI